MGHRGVIGELGDHHPAIGMTHQNDGFPDSLHGLLHSLRVGCQVAEGRRIGSRARQLLDHLDAMPGLPQPVGDLAPVPAADEATGHEDEGRHRESVKPATPDSTEPTGPDLDGSTRHPRNR